MSPAFHVGVGSDELADLGRELVLPEELHIVAGVGLVHAGGNDGAGVEGRHVLTGALRRPAGLRQGDVEVGLGGVGLEGAGGVHAGLGGGALEGRRFLQRGLHFRGDGDDVHGADEVDLGVEAGVEGVEQLAGRGVLLSQGGELLLGRGVGVDAFGDLGEGGLVLVQVGKADGKELVERSVDHLFVAEGLRVGVRTVLVVAVGAREEVGLHPRGIVLQGGDDGGVGLGEVRLGLGVFGCGEGFWHIVLEEADQTVDLLQRDLGVDMRRLLHITAAFGEDLRDLLFALDGRAQADVHGSVGPLHDGEDGVRDAGGVIVRVLVPVADDFKME